MPGIGSSIGQAVKAAGEAVIKPTTDTLQASVVEGVVEPILGTSPKPQTQTDSTQSKPPANASTSLYNPAQKQNVVNFLNALADQDKRSKSIHEAEENAKKSEEEEIKKQTEIKQIEVKKAKRTQMLNRAVFDKQRDTEIKKGGF